MRRQSGLYIATIAAATIGNNLLSSGEEQVNTSSAGPGAVALPGLCDVFVQIQATMTGGLYLQNVAGTGLYPNLVDSSGPEFVNLSNGGRVMRRQVILPPFPVQLLFYCSSNPDTSVFIYIAQNTE